jgi:hypothetical protein
MAVMGAAGVKMIRFYKSYLGRLLLGFLILIELERTTDKQTVADQVRKWQPPDPTVAQTIELLLDSYINDYPDESPSNDDVVKGAIGQLQKRRNDDSDLLDLIVNALKLPFTGSFGGNALKALREAVLTPSELSDLRKLYRAGSKCSCGHEFTTNEMVSATVAQDAITLKCTKCARPQVGRCDHCGNPTPLIGKVAANWRTDIDCGCLKKAERAAKQAGTPADITDKAAALARFREVSRTLRSGYPGKRATAQELNNQLASYIYQPAVSGPIAADDDDDNGGF